MAALRLGGQRGQATVEMALVYTGIVVPLFFGVIFVSEMYWVWHSMNEFTRDGARYAATHCYQSGGGNVVQYMQTHVPATVDRQQFEVGGGAIIGVSYFQRDATTGQLGPFTCGSSDCSVDCVPDAVTINVTNYQFSRFVGFLRLPPIVMPPFLTSMTIESNGCDPEQGTCAP